MKNEKRIETLSITPRDSVGARIAGVTDNWNTKWTREQEEELIERRQKTCESWYTLAEYFKRSGYAVEKKAKDIVMHADEYPTLRGCDIHHAVKVKEWQEKHPRGVDRNESRAVTRMGALPLQQQRKVVNYLDKVARGLQQIEKARVANDKHAQKKERAARAMAKRTSRAIEKDLLALHKANAPTKFPKVKTH